MASPKPTFKLKLHLSRIAIGINLTQTMQKTIEQLQYITHAAPSLTHSQLAEAACKGGVKWIQLRVKDQPYDKWLAIAQETKTICDKYGATLIINDSVKIAHEVKAHGVHLGKKDMCPTEARQILGDNSIIGGTANTFEDVKKACECKVDYIGLGPYRFTITKENLSPTLGSEGYSDIIRACKENNINVPIFAIGGIRVEDVKEIMATGVHGIAVGTAIGFGDTTNNAKRFTQGLTGYELSITG